MSHDCTHWIEYIHPLSWPVGKRWSQERIDFVRISLRMTSLLRLLGFFTSSIKAFHMSGRLYCKCVTKPGQVMWTLCGGPRVKQGTRIALFLIAVLVVHLYCILVLYTIYHQNERGLCTLLSPLKRNAWPEREASLCSSFNKTLFGLIVFQFVLTIFLKSSIGRHLRLKQS